MSSYQQTRRTTAATVLVAVALVTAGCGGGQSHATQSHATGSTATTRPGTTSPPAATASDTILSVSALGRFTGRCPRGARTWSVGFVDDTGANDAVSYRVGRGTPRTVNVAPGQLILITLVPNSARTHEPPDRFMPPGQGRGRSSATTVPTTAPIDARIYQGTEPQILRADVHLALAAAGGENGQCVLVGSAVDANTYPNSA